ncbi:MAG: HAD hydrolase-like protein [Caldilineaceae bacterium]
MAAYKLVIFDFDGTLADSFGWFMRSVHSVAQRFHFTPPDLDRLEELRGYSSRQLMAQFGIAWWKLPFIIHHMRRLMNEQVSEIKPFPGVDELLHTLTNTAIDIAIVTSNSEKNVKAVLGTQNMALVRASSYGAALYGKQRRFSTLLKQCRCLPTDALCVGDEIRDAEAAAACGIDFLGVAWGFTKPSELQKYTRLKICDSVEEILTVATGNLPHN